MAKEKGSWFWSILISTNDLDDMMITSDIQLKATKEQLQRLNSAVGAKMGEHIPKQLIDGHNQKLSDDIRLLESEIDEYERLKSTNVEDIVITSIDDLLKAPIYYRIAAHMTV